MKKDAEEGRLNVRLSKEFLRRLKIECARRGITIQAAAQESLTAWLKGARP